MILQLDRHFEIARFISDRPHSISHYYPTALRRVQIKRVQINITRYLYSRGPVRRFPAVDQSVSWISRANLVPLRILLSRIPP